MLTLLQTIGATFGCWVEWRRRNAAISELRALNDRTLKDMGLTRGEIVAAVDGKIYRGEQVRPRERELPSPPTPGLARIEAIDAAAARGYVDRARQLRAQVIAGLVRYGFNGMVRLLRRAVMPLDPPPGHHRAHPMKENRHADRSNHAA